MLIKNYIFITYKYTRDTYLYIVVTLCLCYNYILNRDLDKCSMKVRVQLSDIVASIDANIFTFYLQEEAV